MTMIELIEKKRDGGKLSKEEIQFLISGYTKGEIPDYQMSAFLMAVYLKGMDDNEATNLALEMLASGDSLDLSMIDGVKVDKHSTGGVGDKTSLVLAPLVASLGINFAKMSGRGLGHTGGTLDKLESIKGYNINISPEDFIKQVQKINIALVGQSGNLTPADKKLYALRDVTGTVSSIPLIASSIMSKKLASGAGAICLDVKVGAGAFMKTIEEAVKLAELMVQIGKNCGRHMTAILTNMEEPLGFAVGNSLEVIEAMETLKGNGPKDLLDLCLEIGAYLVIDAGIESDFEKAKILLMKNIENGKALQKLKDLIAAQGGCAEFADNYELFEQTAEILEVKLEQGGYVAHIDALKIGHAAMLLGAGREKLTDVIDHSVGIVLNKKVGDYVASNETVAYVYSNGRNKEECIKMVKEAYNISGTPTKSQLILKVIR